MFDNQIIFHIFADKMEKMSKLDEIFNDASVVQTQDTEVRYVGCSPKIFDFKWSFFLSRKEYESYASEPDNQTKIKDIKKKIETILDYSRFIKERTPVFFMNRTRFYRDDETPEELNYDVSLDAHIRYVDINFAFNGSIRDIFSFIKTICLIKHSFIFSIFLHPFNLSSLEISISDGTSWKIDDKIYLADFPYLGVWWNNNLISDYFYHKENIRKLYKMFTYMAGKHDAYYIPDATMWIQIYLKPGHLLEAFDPEIGNAMAIKPDLVWEEVNAGPIKLKIKDKNSRFFWQFFATGSVGMCHYNTEYFVVDEINKAIEEGRLSRIAHQTYTTMYKDTIYSMAYMGRIFIRQELSHIDVALLVSEKKIKKEDGF